MHWMFLMADATTAATSSLPISGDTLLAGLVGTLGGGGFSVWYGYHMTTKIVPGLINDHREERALDREERLNFQQNVKDLTGAINGLGCRQMGHV
jgi:hypothetical protein